MPETTATGIDAPPRAAGTPAVARRRLWPWLLGTLLLVLLLAAALGTSAVLALAGLARDGVHIHIDGQRWTPDALSVQHWLAALALASLLALGLMLVLGVLLPLALLVAGLAALAGMGSGLLALLALVLLLASPLWLPLALLGWWLVRRRATMPA